MSADSIRDVCCPDLWDRINELEAENQRVVAESKQCHEQNDRLVSERLKIKAENERLRETLNAGFDCYVAQRQLSRRRVRRVMKIKSLLFHGTRMAVHAFILFPMMVFMTPFIAFGSLMTTGTQEDLEESWRRFFQHGQKIWEQMGQ